MKTIIADLLKEYAAKNPLRLHMPGHKGKSVSDLLFGEIFKYDVTEVEDLKIEEAVERAEADISRLYGAKKVRMITGGSSLGVLSLVYAASKEGKSLVIPRSAHKSVYNALALFGVEPILIGNVKRNGLFENPTIEETVSAVLKNPGCSGALLTYPDYYGRRFNVKEIYEKLKSCGKKLFLDAAHGAHLPFFCEENFGAICDAFVVSAHKTLCSLNSGAIIGVNNLGVCDAIFTAAEKLSTTSPSYPILASIEYGIKKAAEEYEKNLLLAKEIDKTKDKIENLGVKVLHGTESFKIVVDLTASGIDRKKAKISLRKNGIYEELDDGDRLLFMFSFETDKEDIEVFYRAIEEISVLKGRNTIDCLEEEVFEGGKIDFLAAINAEKEQIALENAIGRICAESFGTFPPCYPECVAGEVVSKRVIDAIKGKETFGINRGKITTVKGK